MTPAKQLCYSIPEVSRMLGICKDTVYNEINAGRLRTFKVGPRRRFVSHDALMEFIKAREAATA